MSNEYFVKKNSVVRRIWGKSDTILFIFAGAAAEFALNKAVDWLYFTGRLPVDPIGRLFSTVSYARAIVFSEKKVAWQAIDSMAKIHKQVESNRKQAIPDWAYHDVLFLLIDYSIRSFEVLERPLTKEEKADVFETFKNIGLRMGLSNLPNSFDEWILMRHMHLSQDLMYSSFTDDLFKQYRKHLGLVRYRILLEVQALVVPQLVRDQLHLRKISMIHPLVAVYKASRLVKLDWILRSLLLPARYKKEIDSLDRAFMEN